MAEKIFCKNCKKRIDTLPFVGEKYHEFQDGYYCDNCARLVVNKRRKK